MGSCFLALAGGQITIPARMRKESWIPGKKEGIDEAKRMPWRERRE